jgi:hypothetical protein
MQHSSRPSRNWLALEVVLSAPPTTITDVADLLDYVSSYQWEPLAGEYPGSILESAKKGNTVEEVRKAAANFLPIEQRRCPDMPRPLLRLCSKD